MNRADSSQAVRTSIDIAISLTLVGLLLFWCLRIVQPFLSIIVWGAVIAIACAVPVARLATALGGGRKRAVLLFAAIGLAVVLVPSVLFAETLIDGMRGVAHALETREFALPSPREGVREWPLVGERLYGAWHAAADDTEAWLATHAEQLRGLLGGLLGRVAGFGLAVLQLVASIIVAALMLANADAAQAAAQRFFVRLMGDERATAAMRLSVATVRSVTVGVLGIAAIQSVAGGIGMVAVGVPAAGLLALVILLLAVAQLPPWLVLAPVIVYVFSEHSMPVATAFAIWSVIVSFADMFLKPIMLGRGVDAPMPVILIGAIGGMLMSGIIGLFVGAVVLALGYQLFEAWLASGPGSAEPAAESLD